MKIKTHEEQILWHLQRYGSITDAKARNYYHTNRCSEYIRRLREKGHNIVTEWETSKDAFGRKVKYGVYVLCR